MSTSFLCSIAADLAMAQLTRFVLGIGVDVADTLLQYCGFTHATTVSPLNCNPKCQCNHSVWKRVHARRPLSGASLRCLSEKAGLSSASDSFADVAFTVGELAFVQSAYCCKQVQPMRRFVGDGEIVGRCNHCQAELRAQRVFSKDRVSAAELGLLLDHPLNDLGAGSVQWVAVHNAAETVLLN